MKSFIKRWLKVIPLFFVILFIILAMGVFNKRKQHFDKVEAQQKKIQEFERCMTNWKSLYESSSGPVKKTMMNEAQMKDPCKHLLP